MKTQVLEKLCFWKRDTEELTEKADAQEYTKNLQRVGIYGKQSTFQESKLHTKQWPQTFITF